MARHRAAETVGRVTDHGAGHVGAAVRAGLDVRMLDSFFSLTCGLPLDATVTRLGTVVHRDRGWLERFVHALTVTAPQPLWFWGSLSREGFRFRRSHVRTWGME